MRVCVWRSRGGWWAGSSGIGKAIAEMCADQGISVVLVSLADPLLKKTAAELRAKCASPPRRHQLLHFRSPCTSGPRPSVTPSALRRRRQAPGLAVHRSRGRSEPVRLNQLHQRNRSRCSRPPAGTAPLQVPANTSTSAAPQPLTPHRGLEHASLRRPPAATPGTC